MKIRDFSSWPVNFEVLSENCGKDGSLLHKQQHFTKKTMRENNKYIINNRNQQYLFLKLHWYDKDSFLQQLYDHRLSVNSDYLSFFQLTCEFDVLC